MLTYFSDGSRDYARRNLRVETRSAWEFQAVTRGSLAPLMPGGEEPEYVSKTMWVFPPGVAHGWSTRRSRPCEMVVFHFDTVPEPLVEATGSTAVLQVSLTTRDVADLRRMAADIQQHHPKVTDLSVMWADRTLLELVLLALRGRPGRPLTESPDYSERKVRQALSWFIENMPDGVGVNEMAEAVGVSPAHLRRLFAEAGGGSPLERLTEIRLRRAKELLLGTTMDIAQIAEAVGMSGPTTFCRRFKQARGVSPGRWRESQ